ncbi:hypothetical protein Tco_1071643 [Tanacetum coccineum]
MANEPNKVQDAIIKRLRTKLEKEVILANNLLDSRIQPRKGTVENSFPLASTEVVENVKIVQYCNGLLLCTGLGWPSCYYIWDYEDVHDLGSVETEFPAIVFNDIIASDAILSCEPTISPLNDKVDFRISFDESDDEDYTMIYDKNSFSYKIIYVDDLKTDSKNDNDKVNMPLFPSPEPSVSCIDDLDFFKDFENEFPAIVYNDALTSKSDFSTEPTLCP